MHLPPVTTPVHADQLPLERLAENSRIPEADKIREVARQFEAVLLRQILAQTRKSLHDDALGESKGSLGIYQDLINETLADNISRSGMLGLGSSLQSQLTRQNVTPPATEPVPPP